MFMLGRSDHKKKIPVWLGILLVVLGLILLSFVWMYLIAGPELFSSMRGFDTTQEDAFREDSILDVSDVVFQMIDQNQLSPDETIKIDENDMKYNRILENVLSSNGEPLIFTIIQDIQIRDQNHIFLHVGNVFLSNKQQGYWVTREHSDISIRRIE